MRKRVVDMNELLHSPDLWEASKPRPERGFLFYELLWALAEDSGVLEADWKKIALKSGILKMTAAEVEKRIKNYVAKKKIIEFECNSQNLLWLRNFAKHQTFKNPAIPSLPLPPWMSFQVLETPGTKRKYAKFAVDGKVLAPCLGSLQGGDKPPTCALDRDRDRDKDKLQLRRGPIRDAVENPNDNGSAFGAQGGKAERKTIGEKTKRFNSVQRAWINRKLVALENGFGGKRFARVFVLGLIVDCEAEYETVQKVLLRMEEDAAKIENPHGWLIAVIEREYGLFVHELWKKYDPKPGELERVFAGAGGLP